MADELEVLDGLVEDFGKFKTKSAKQIIDLQKEAQEQIAKVEQKHLGEITAVKTEHDAKVAELTTKLTEAGSTIGQIQSEIEELKAKGGRIIAPGAAEAISTISLLKEAFAEHGAKIAEQEKRPKAAFEFIMKAVGNMTIADNLTGNGVATYNLTPALRPRRKLHFRDLVDVVNSATGIWKFYRGNKPPGEGSFLNQTPGALKQQVDYDLTEVTVTTSYLAGFVRIAKQMLQDLPFMQSFLPQELIEDYLRAEDYQFFQQLTAAANGNTSGVTATVTIEKIIQGIAALGEDDYDANGIVVTNAVWAKILNTKPNDYSLPAGGAVTVDGNGNVRIVGIPLYRTNATNIGTNNMIIGDWSRAKIIQTDGLSVNMYEQDQDNVIRNLITVKAEARVALAILRTDAFIYTAAGTT
jgi:HK97 family phage major capsid protein